MQQLHIYILSLLQQVHILLLSIQEKISKFKPVCYEKCVRSKLKRFLPWPIGMLFLIGGVILGIDLMVPMLVEVAGYAAEGLAIAWSAFLIWRESKPVAHTDQQ